MGTFWSPGDRDPAEDGLRIEKSERGDYSMVVDLKKKLATRIDAYKSTGYTIERVDKDRSVIVMRKGKSQKGIELGIDKATGITSVNVIFL